MGYACNWGGFGWSWVGENLMGLLAWVRSFLRGALGVCDAGCEVDEVRVSSALRRWCRCESDGGGVEIRNTFFSGYLEGSGYDGG